MKFQSTDRPITHHFQSMSCILGVCCCLRHSYNNKKRQMSFTRMCIGISIWIMFDCKLTVWLICCNNPDSVSVCRCSFCLSCSLSRKPRKGKGQKGKGKKNREKKQDLYVTSAFASSHLHLSVALLVVKLIWEEICCLL